MLGKWQGGVEHLDKFKASLAVRLPDTWPDDQVEDFVNYWADAIKIAWQTITPQVDALLALLYAMHQWLWGNQFAERHSYCDVQITPGHALLMSSSCDRPALLYSHELAQVVIKSH